ncbi:MAG: hypothetical protein QM535_10170 [Limnohabitans sp.]|nr:hypothetical protein [Limnohabitans sp.]
MSEHNPIAENITRLQQIWITNRKENPNARIFCWRYQAQDYFFLNSFYKLESSQYNATTDAFVIFFNPFENKEKYTISLIQQWLNQFEEEAKKQGWQWNDLETFKERFSNITPTDYDAYKILWKDILISYKAFDNKPDTKLFIGIMPHSIGSEEGINIWIEETLSLLPNDIGYVTHQEDSENILYLVEKKIVTKTLQVPNFDLKGAYKQIATQGNPTDPQVQFRRCMFEMGEAAGANNKSKLNQWGQKMLEVTQSTGNRSFWASAHLVYAGFLFQFKDDEKIEELLNKGIAITAKEYKDKPESAGVLLQLYAYKGSYASMTGKKEEALEWFTKQAHTATELQLTEQALLAYNNLLLLAQKNKNDFFYNTIKESFEVGYPLKDEQLKNINFTFIANYYCDYFTNNGKYTRNEIEERMKTIYGENWKENATNFKQIVVEEEKENE